MTKYNVGLLLNSLRERIGLEREAMLDFGSIDESSLRRIERGKQHPKPETLEALMETIGIPLEVFVYSPLENQPMGVYLLCDRLSQLLDIGDIDTAENILTELENTHGFDYGALLQFVLSKKAELWELQNKSASQIIPLIEQGMAQTFENFDLDNLEGKILILEESELLHTKARVIAKAGEVGTAVKILEQLVSSMIKLPGADRDKERQFAPVLLSLSKLLLKIGDNNRVLEICELGAEYSAKWKKGELNPDFELNRACALLALNRTDECRCLLQQAYFGYMLLGETSKAQDVLDASENHFGIQFELYGVEEIDFSHKVRIPSSRGDAVDCNSLGDMISALRKRANLTQLKLCKGICSESTLSRIEDNNGQVSFFIFEAIMQRLGRNVDLYKNFFLSEDEFLAIQLRDKINSWLIEMRLDEAAKLITEFEKMLIVRRSNVLKQFLHMSKAHLFGVTQSKAHPDYPVMLLDALKITCPQFDERDIDNYRLSYNEIALINQYAGYLGKSGDTNRSADIYARLRRNLESFVVDEVERSRSYSTIMFNYSISLGRSGRRMENQAVIDDGESFERSRRHLIELPGFAFNKGYNLLMLDKKEGCIPYFALAYYGTALFAKHGQKPYLSIIQEKAKSLLGIVFN